MLLLLTGASSWGAAAPDEHLCYASLLLCAGEHRLAVLEVCGWRWGAYKRCRQERLCLTLVLHGELQRLFSLERALEASWNVVI